MCHHLQLYFEYFFRQFIQICKLYRNIKYRINLQTFFRQFVFQFAQ